jgi:hypothetical protein
MTTLVLTPSCRLATMRGERVVSDELISEPTEQLEYTPPLTFEEAVEALDENERGLPCEVLDLDEIDGYRQGLADALTNHFGGVLDEHEELYERLEEALLLTGMTDEVGGIVYRRKLPDSPEVKKMDARLGRVTPSYLEARQQFHRAFVDLLMAQHRNGWEQGVADVDKYIPLVRDLFVTEN